VTFSARPNRTPPCGETPAAHAGRGRRAEAPARAGQAAARRLRVRQAAFDDPVGAARLGQDHARAPDGAGLRSGVHRALGGALGREGHPRRRARPSRRWRRAGAARSSSSTRCTASTRRSRTPSCPSSSGPVHLRRRDHREPFVRSEFGVAVAGDGVRAGALSATIFGVALKNGDKTR
jgi:hypothetical protein